MSVQATYKTQMDAARAGMIADTTANVLVSRDVETVAGIGFGKAVKRGSADRGIAITVADDTAVFGITVREVSTDANNPDVFPRYSSARVMLKGAIWVQVGANVTAGNPVFVTVDGGAFTGASGTGKVAIAGAVFDTSATSGNLAVVRLG